MYSYQSNEIESGDREFGKNEHWGKIQRRIGSRSFRVEEGEKIAKRRIDGLDAGMKQDQSFPEKERRPANFETVKRKFRSIRSGWCQSAGKQSNENRDSSGTEKEANYKPHEIYKENVETYDFVNVAAYLASGLHRA